MPDLVATRGPNERWRRTLPSQPVTLGRIAKMADWAVPWDEHISRLHATLVWKEGQGLLVRKDTTWAKNSIYYRNEACDEFTAQVGEFFVIGETRFFVVGGDEDHTPQREATPLAELTCSRGELDAVRFADVEDRVEVLAELPGMIRYSPGDAELERRVLEVLLRGVPRAEAAAVVRQHDAGPAKEGPVEVREAARRDGRPAELTPSRRLLAGALRRQQGVLHVWGNKPDSDSSFPAKEGDRFQSLAADTWSMCVPLPDDPAPGWALYVTGRQAPPTPGHDAEAFHKSDLKFVSLVADVFGALRQVRDLQRRQAILSQFFSRPVLAALAQKDMDEVLKQRETDVTVLFCDLRGSCRIAEQAGNELAGVCERVGAALGIMTSNIIDWDGVIGDFQGDAAMGFWGWPLDSDKQVEQAARAALAIRRDFLRAAQRPGNPLAGFACGIGIAHGRAIAGRLGTAEQFKVGVFGPVVNLAARLESMTKFFQVPILVDEAVAARLGKTEGSHWERCRRLALVRPFGMTKTLLVHELLPAAVEAGALKEAHRSTFESAVDAFLRKRWQLAEELLERLPRDAEGGVLDGPARFLQTFMEKHGRQPPVNWDGVIELEGK
jgi:adenylate cyclase